MAGRGKRRLMLGMKWNLDMLPTKKSDDVSSPVKRLDIKLSGPDFVGFADIVPAQTNKEAMAEYNEKFKASLGFDIDEIQGHFTGLVIPVDLKHHPGFSKDANALSEIAIQKYNLDHGTRYRFMQVIKVNTQPVAGFKHYITFEALDEGKVPPAAAAETFQTLGYRLMPDEKWPDGLVIDFCRVKPT